MLGHGSTVYEFWPEPGGVLVYGIPNFKMRKNIVDEYIAHLEALGVKFVCNTYVGKDVTIDGMLDGGVRRGLPRHGRRRRQPDGDRGRGPDQGVYSATEFLVRGNLTAGSAARARTASRCRS